MGDINCGTCVFWQDKGKKCPWGHPPIDFYCGRWKGNGESGSFLPDLGPANFYKGEKNLDNAVEIIKKKSDLMNMLRNQLKVYDIKADNNELSLLINEKKEEINHALIDKLGAVVHEIAEEYKENHRMEKGGEDGIEKESKSNDS